MYDLFNLSYTGQHISVNKHFYSRRHCKQYISYDCVYVYLWVMGSGIVGTANFSQTTNEIILFLVKETQVLCRDFCRYVHGVWVGCGVGVCVCVWGVNICVCEDVIKVQGRECKDRIVFVGYNMLFITFPCFSFDYFIQIS